MYRLLLVSILFSVVSVCIADSQKDLLELYQRSENSKVIYKKPLTQEQLQKVFLMADTNKVAQLTSLQKYDPKDRIGYNFGSAISIYLTARKMGVASNLIRKVFMVGPLTSEGGEEWRFQVATVILGLDDREVEQWYVLDPIMMKPVEKDSPGRPILLSKWVENLRNNFQKDVKKTKLYLTQSSAILPDLSKIALTPADEKDEFSDKVIGYGFNPERLFDFVIDEKTLPGEKLFVPNGKALDQYFFTIGRDVKSLPFNFVTLKGSIRSVGMTSAAYTFDIESYFNDLLREIDSSSYGMGRAISDGTEIHGTEIHRGKMGARLLSPLFSR